MKEIKLIVSDIDGTLIDSKHECPIQNQKGIDYVRKKGIPFAIGTGRPYAMVKKNLKKWGLENLCDYLVCNNGGTVIDCKKQTEVNQNHLSKEVIFQVIEAFEDLEVSLCVFDEDTLVTNQMTDAYHRRCKEAHIHKKCEDLKNYISHSYPKMLLISENDIQKEILKRFEQIQPSNYRMFASSPILTEVVNPNLSKVVGIDVLCQQLHINRENVLCFGDEMNDFEMLSSFKGVAMENAVNPIKEICEYQTSSCQEGGVGEFLLKHF
ncbi:HAD family hydrolase [Floccifex sp.]|uniref:HAD family hydrolase n=1 Tax=Floccifex sp. TaxID=2815810 RepID=UPI003F095BD0